MKRIDVPETNKCDTCIWSTRSGGCVSWNCSHISHSDAREMIRAYRQMVKKDAENDG